MSTTAGQKLAALALPAAAFILAVATSGPEWSPPRVQGSWRETMHPETARGGTAPVPASPAGEAAPEAGKTPPPETAKKPSGPAEPAPSAKAPPAEAAAPAPSTPPVEAPKPAEPKAPPVLPTPGEVEFKVTGLAFAKTASTLTHPARDRLDIHVLASGAVRLGADFSDPDAALAAIREAAEEQRASGLLYIVPLVRAPWDGVRALAAAGAEAGWRNVGLGAVDPEKQAQGKVVLLDIPATEEPTARGLDPILVRVMPGLGSSPTFEVNGEACRDAAAVLEKARFLHAECEEGYEAGYSGSVDATPWIVDGSGATAGGVIAALDALRTAGVKTVRLAGIRRPSAEEGK